MKAVTCTESRLAVVDLPEPRPARGQVLLEVVRAGICGSDLHLRHQADELAEVSAQVGYGGMMRSHETVVLGHEFSGRVLEHGPRTRRRLREGRVAVAMPLIRHGDRVHPTGLSEQAPGAYAERVLVQEALTFPVPNGLSPESAALTEPMAVALHAVRRGQVGKGRVAIVVGCGPVGLAVIAMLKATGVRHVIASDLAAGRRALAATMGADLVVDPRTNSPFATAAEHDHLTEVSQVFDRAVEGMSRLTLLPQWWHAYRAAEKLGLASPKSPVVFECVGVPGMLEVLLRQVPLAARVVVVGVCVGEDRLRPALAINKELDLRFALGYSPLDFRDALHLLADGKVDAASLVTGTVGLPGVASAFEALAHPGTHAKILIDPASDAALAD